MLTPTFQQQNLAIALQSRGHILNTAFDLVGVFSLLRRVAPKAAGNPKVIGYLNLILSLLLSNYIAMASELLHIRSL